MMSANLLNTFLRQWHRVQRIFLQKVSQFSYVLGSYRLLSQIVKGLKAFLFNMLLFIFISLNFIGSFGGSINKNPELIAEAINKKTQSQVESE